MKKGTERGLNLWRLKGFFAPTPSVRQPLFEASECLPSHENCILQLVFAKGVAGMWLLQGFFLFLAILAVFFPLSLCFVPYNSFCFFFKETNRETPLGT